MYRKDMPIHMSTKNSIGHLIYLMWVDTYRFSRSIYFIPNRAMCSICHYILGIAA